MDPQQRVAQSVPAAFRGFGGFKFGFGGRVVEDAGALHRIPDSQPGAF